MANINDRRSSNDAKQSTVEKDAGVQRHADGSVRRITPGIRSLRDFLDPDNADKTMTRGDTVNALAALFYYERESRWYRRVVRFFQHQPQVKSVIAELANAHARGLEAAKEQMQDQVAHAAKAAQAFNAGTKA